MELRLALLRTIHDCREVGRGEVLQRVARTFSWWRTSAQIAAEVSETLDGYITRGFVLVDGGGRCRLAEKTQAALD